MSTAARPVDPRLFRWVPSLRCGAAALGVLGAVGAVGVVIQLAATAAAVTAVVSPGSGRDLTRPLAVLAAATLARAVPSWLERRVADRTAARLQAELGTALVRAGLRLGPHALADHGAGRLTTLATSGVDALGRYVTRYLPSLVPAAVLPPAVVGVLLVVDAQSAVTVALTLPLVPVFGAVVGWATERRAREQWTTMSRLAAHFLDAVQGLPTLRAHRRAERQVEVLRDVGDHHRVATVRVLRLAFLSGTALDLVGTLSVGLVAVSAGLRVAGGSLDFGTALLAILLAPEAYRPLRELGARFHASADATAVLDEMATVLDTPSVLDGTQSGAGPAPSVAPSVAVHGERLVARLPGRASPVLDGIDVHVGRGRIVAVVGPSGAGKSTLVRAVAGLLPLDAGRLHVTGAVAYLPQRPTFPHARTLGEAVLAGWPAAPPAVVRRALVDAAADRWIDGLPDGPRTPLREAGAGLSAGQRQRLALARTLVQASRPGVTVLVLDEPTAHLDQAAERQVLARLRPRADDGLAVLMVAHRPACIAAADDTVTVPGAPAQPSGAPDTGGPPSPAASPRPRPLGRAAVPRWPRLRIAAALAAGTGSALSGVALTATAAWLLTRATDQPPVLTLTTAVVGVRLFAISRPLLGYLDRLVSHDVALAALGRWRAEVYERLVPRVPGAAVPRRGDLLTRLVDDVDSLPDGLLRWRRPATVAALTLMLGLLGAVALHPPAAVAALPGLLVAGVAAPLIAGSGAVRRSTREATTRARHREAVVETLGGAEDVAALGSEATGLAPVTSARRDTDHASRAQARRDGLAEAVRLLGHGVAVLAVAVITAPAVGRGAVPVEAFAVLVLGTLALGEVTAALPDAALARARVRTARCRLDAVLDTPPSAVEPARPLPLRPDRSVRARSLAAGWDQGAPPVLRHVDLDLPAGARVAVQGPSGAGKSTLVAVLMRFLDPASGSVTLGGRDLRRLGGDDVRSVVGLVGDDEHVFATSLRENLRLAAPDAGDASLAAALRHAHLGGWLDALPHGLDTWLGEGGALMSAGERRRLAMARALLADLPVLVLDEPAESLDEVTARAVLDDLLAASAGRTVLLVTHRDEGLDRMHRVLRLTDGQLREPDTTGPAPGPTVGTCATAW